MAKVGDTVRFLNFTGGGVIAKIDGKIAYVEDFDGFQTPILIHECVVVNTEKEKRTAFDRPEEVVPSKYTAPEPVSPEFPEELPIVETDNGDRMNVVVAFEPINVKNLSATRFAIYLVNDSNYYLSFAFLARGDEGWRVINQNTVEPNIQLSLGEISHDDLPQMSQIAFQATAYKKDKQFEIKNPINYRHKLDVTKFYKLHTFRENDYFDAPVFAIPIVVDDIPQRQVEIDPVQLNKAINQKESVHTNTKASKQSEKRAGKVDVIDLHIHELLDDITGLSNADMLDVQLTRFRREMDSRIKHAGSRVVFIHGKGEGVLRKAITDELKRKYPRCDWHDASFREYGFGATEVIIH